MKYYWKKKGENPNYILFDKTEGINGMKNWLLKIIPNNESILDIGCGPGVVYEIFKKADRKNDYLGIDIDANGLKLAKIFFPGIQMRHTDAHFLPFQDNSVDNSILFAVIETLPDFRKAIDEAIRVTKKRIIIVVSVKMIKELDYNAWGLSNPPEYIVRINKDKFLNYLQSFKLPISSGILIRKYMPKHWWWIVHKNER